MSLFQGSDSLYLDRVMYTFTEPWTWIPLYVGLLYLVIKNNESMKQILLLLCLAIISVSFADLMVDNVVKPLTERWRPAQDPMLKYTIDIVNGYRGGKYGFFSAHAANTMSVSLFFCLVVRSWRLSSMLIFWSLLNGFTRIYLGVHYPSDVFIGWIWGCVVAVLSYIVYIHFYKKISTGTTHISSQYTHTGYAYKDIFIISCILIFTLIYVMFRAIFPL